MEIETALVDTEVAGLCLTEATARPEMRLEDEGSPGEAGSRNYGKSETAGVLERLKTGPRFNIHDPTRRRVDCCLLTMVLTGH